MTLIRFKLFWKFFKFVLPQRKKWLVTLALSGISTLIGLANPYLIKLVIDEAIRNKDLKNFITLVLIGGGIFILNGLLSGAQQFLERYIKLKVKFGLNKKIFEQMQNLSFGWFQNRSTGEHIYKINEDIERVEDFITIVPPQAVSLLPKSIFILIIIFYLNWEMALFSLCLAPFLYLPPYYFSRKIEKVWEVLIKNYEDIFKDLQEFFSHIQLVKVFGREAGGTRKHFRKIINSIRLETKNIKLEIFSSFTAEGVGKVIVGLIALYGGYRVIKGQMTLGSLTAIMIYLRQLVSLQGQFAYFIQATAIGLVSCQRLTDILDEKPKVAEARDAQSAIFKNGEILFKDINFGYKQGEFILRNLTFSIKGGKHIAITGPSGCGKTTLLNLLIRLYDPLSGEIIIDGYKIRDLKFNSLKRQIGFALQEPLLWNDSIENNIRYGKEGSTPEEIIKAAEMSDVDEFARGLPLGYQTVIGENACKLSEGQKQKIAIARALIKNPKILILDEAMASMDSASEEKIIANIKQSRPAQTIITVSHRLSTVMMSDLVYYFYKPDTMLIDELYNLLERNKEFSDLFIGQGQINTIWT